MVDGDGGEGRSPDNAANTQLAQVEASLEETGERLRALHSAFSLTGRRMGAAQRREDDALRQRRWRLRRRYQQLAEAASLRAEALCGCATLCTAPNDGCTLATATRRTALVAMAALASALCVGLGTSLVEGANRSLCGGACGFLVYAHTTWNPLDVALQSAALFYPLDAALVAALLLLLAGATLVGGGHLGLRFVGMPLWPLRIRGSSAPAVCLVALHVSLTALASVVLVHAAAPQYAAFGAQVYVDSSGSVRPCSLECTVRPGGAAAAASCEGRCVLSSVASALLLLLLRVPLHGALTYYTHWAFLGALAVCCVYAAARRGLEDGDDSPSPLAARSRRQRGGGGRSADGSVAAAAGGALPTEATPLRESCGGSARPHRSDSPKAWWAAFEGA